MKTKVKRLWSLLLAVVMVFAVMPGSALAVSDEEVQAAEAAGEISLDGAVIEADEPMQFIEDDAPDSIEDVSEQVDPVVPEEEPIAAPEVEPEEEHIAAPEAEPEEEPQTDAAAPTITALTLEVDGETYAADFHGGSMYVSIPAELTLSGAAVNMTTSEAVVFVPKTNAADGELYAAEATESSVGLNFNLSVGGEDLNGAAYRITLTTDDQMEWSGTICSAFNVPVGTLAAGLSAQENAGLAAGTMRSAATGTQGEARALYCNQDAKNVQMLFCPTDAVVRTVVYDCGDTVYTWKVPNGLPLQNAAAPELSGKTFDAWYLDEDCETAAGIGEAVTADMTLYAGYTDNVVAGSFADQVVSDAMILTISNLTDFEAFMELAGDIKAGRLVRLTADIDCDGKTYTAITGFKENFDGNNKTISNATFKAVDGYSGMFKTIGADQKICNLILENVTAKYAGTYSGILVGSVSGTEGHNALIQNVQVYGGTASGRSAGGIAGFIFFTDVKYCAVYGTTITGIANGGGIGGISYGFITQSCSDTRPTALTIKGIGGIAGKNLEGGTITNSWCTYDSVVGTSTLASESNVLPKVDEKTSLGGIGLDTTKWVFMDGELPFLDMDSCICGFGM